jgi:hypothetical protein
MDMKQNPFSFYDFLGYFTPGALFLYGVMAGFAHTQSSLNIIDYIAANLSFGKPELYIPFILVAYTLGHILAFISSGMIERYSIWTVGYPSKYLLGISSQAYFDVEKHKALRVFIRIVVAILLAPISILDFVVGKIMGFRDLYAKSLDHLLVRVIAMKVGALMQQHAGLEKPPSETNVREVDFFRYVYHYAVEHAPNHLPKMQNYVALYGFLRTLTLLVVMLFWALVWHAYMGLVCYLEGGILIASSGILAFVAYMAFVKFYRRFSLEAFMALAATLELNSADKPQ